MSGSHERSHPAHGRRPLAPVVLQLLLGLASASTASAHVDKTVRWARSPLRDAQGQPLPAAVAYEVWVLPAGGTESMAATVTDTVYTLRATEGVSYRVRVRGVSAAGFRSPFSDYSEPWQAPGASATGVSPAAGFGPAYPNPFNAHVTIAYVVPEDLPSGAEPAMRIHDARGRRVRSFELSRDAGLHGQTWDGRDDRGLRMPAGVYIAQFVCGAYRAATRLTLLP